VTAIDPTTNNTTSIPVGRDAGAVAVDPNSHTVYVANTADNTVSIITPSSSGYSTSTVQVGAEPFGIAIAGNGKAYVSNYASASVSIIDPSQNYSVSVISVGSGPGAIAYDAGTNTVIVCDQSSKQASVIDASTLSVTTLAVGSLPFAVATSASRGESYIANESSNTATVITD
jgi:YVTN family beta-propeller protein